MTRITSVRHSLALRTALGVSLGVVAVPATAQTAVDLTALPRGATVDSGIVTVPGQTVQVTVTAPRAVVNWTRFNVPQGTIANFVNGSTGTPTAVVLNRVTALGASNTTTLGGTINAVNASDGRGVEVWIANPNGIVLGANGNFNTQGFVATTRAFDATDVDNFVNGSGALTLTAPVLTPNAGITGQAGRIATNGKVMAFIAPVVRLTGGTFDAGTGDAGFVVASDVTISNPGSPLALVINAGTPVGTGNALDLRGTVNAGNAYMVVSAQAAVNALLNVAADVTTASASNGVVVLGGDNGGAAVGPITVATGAGTSGVIGLTTSGNLTANGGGAVRLLGNSAVTIGGSLTTVGGGDVTVQNYDPISTATVTAQGDVLSSGAYQLAGGVVALGASTQSARGALSVTTRRGAITATGPVTLAADTDGSGDGMQLNGQAGFALGSTLLVSGDASGVARSAIDFKSGTDTDPFTLGEVRARVLTRNGGTPGLSRTSAITTGDLTLAGANSIATTGQLTTGAIATGGALTLNGGAGVRVGGDLGAGTGDVSVTSGGSIRFDGRVDGAGALSVQAGSASDVTFAGPIGAMTPFASFTSSGPATVNLNGGALTTTGAQSFGGRLVLGANTVLTGTGASFADGVSGAGGGVDHDLTLAFSDATTLTGGSFTGIRNLATDAVGTTTLTGAITTSGSQSYGDAVTLTGTTTLTSTGLANDGNAHAITFGKTVDGGAVLTVVTPGLLTFRGDVGGAAALTGVVATGVGGVAIQSSGVTTSGGQSFGATALNGPLTAPVTLRAGGGVSFSALDGPRGLVVITSGVTALAGGSGPAPDFITTDAGGITTVGGTIRTVGAQTYGDPLSLVGATTLTGTVALFGGGVRGNGYDLTINTSGAQRLGDVTGVRDLTTDAAGTLTLTGDIATSGAQRYGEAVTLASSAALTAGPASSIVFGGTVDSADGTQRLATSAALTRFTGDVGAARALGALSVSGATTIGGTGTRRITTSGAQSYDGAVQLETDAVFTGDGASFAGGVDGGAGARSLTLTFAGANTLGGAGLTNIGDLLVNGAGTTTLNGNVTTVRSQTYQSAVVLGGPVTLTSTGAGAILLNGLSGDGALTVGTGGTTTFNAGANGLRSITTLAGGTTVLNGTLLTSGAQAYGNDVRLASDVTLASSGGGTFDFAGTVTGAHALALNSAGRTTFGGVVGRVGGDGLADATLSPTALSSTGPVRVNGGAITTSGAQTYQGPLELGADAVLTGTTGTLGGGVAGNGHDLTLNFSGPTAISGGLFAGVRNLTSGGGGTTTLSGTLSTGGSQLYRDDVVLAGDTVLLSGDGTGAGAIRFEGALDGGHGLTVKTAGATSFGKLVGGVAPLRSLLVNGTGPVAFGGGGITTTGAQQYRGPATLATYTVLTTGGGLAFGGTVDGAYQLSVRAGDGRVSFAGALGGLTPLTGLAIRAGTAGFATGNRVGTLAAALSGGGLSYADRAALTIGTVDGLSGVAANGVSLTGAGLTQVAGATIDGRAAAMALDGGGGAISLADAVLTTSGGADAVRIAGASDIGLGTVRTGAGGTLTLGATGAVTQRAGTTLSAGTLTGTVGGNAVLTNAGNAVGRLGAFNVGGLQLHNGGGLTVSGPIDVGAGGLSLRLDAGDLALAGDVVAPSGTVSLTVPGAIGQTAGRLAAQSLTGNAGGPVTLTGGSNAISALAGFSSGAFTLVNGRALQVTGDVAAAGPLQVTAPGIDFTGRTLAGTGAVTLNGTGGTVAGGAVIAGTDLAVNGEIIAIASARAGSGALNLTSGGSLRLDAGQAGGEASFDANGLATLGDITSGSAITVKALDATVGGTLRANSVAFINRAPASVALRLGDGTAAGGFALDAAEVNRVDAAQLTLDGGTGDVQIGTLGFGAAAGAKRVDVLSTGRVDVTGALSGTGAGRMFRIGGTAAGDGASSIRVVATADAGGRLLFDTAALDLRGTRIAVGQTGGFLDVLGLTSTSADAAALVANPNSALYNAALGGTPYAPGTTLLSANSLTVRYTEYALFQNTGEPGHTAGVALGSAAAGPQVGTLTIQSPAGAANAFALFGTIGGVGGDATALLPPSVVSLNGSDVARTRLNGCTIGSAEGCLTAVATQPLLAVFDNNRVVAVRVEQDLAVPFDPGVGTGNEALFAGLGLPDASVTATQCSADAGSPACSPLPEPVK